MIRFHFLKIILFFLLIGNTLFGQQNIDSLTRKNFENEITNVDVLDAKLWHHQGKIEASLKKGLEVISSNITLSTIDQFNNYQVLAYNYRALGANNLALDHAEQAVKTMLKIKSKDVSKITWIAPYYSAVQQYEKAVSFMKMDIPRFKKEKDTLSLLKLYNDIGFTYSLFNKINSAIHYYNKVIQIHSDDHKFKGIIGLTTGNLGSIYMEKGQYEKALTYIQIDAELSKGRNESSYYNAKNAIGECYLLLKEYNEAEIVLLKLLEISHNDQKARLRTYSLLAAIYDKTQEGNKNALYLKKYIALKDSLQKNEIPVESIFKQLSDAKIKGIKKDLELAENKAKSEELKTKVYFIMLVLSLILILISIIYFRNRQLKNAKILHLESNLLNAELEGKKKDLTNMVTNLSYKRKFIDEVQEKLKSIQHQPNDKISEQVSLIIQEFNSYKNADKNSEISQIDIEKVNISFFNKLGERFPLLTENEKELCGLFLLKLSSKDIASIRNITPNAIKKARQRIRKKLPISEDQDLINFLETV